MKGHKDIRAGWAVGNQHLYKVNHARAKEMRQNPTEAEKVVWEIVRANRLGYKFRRQQTIGEYIVDFVCLIPHPKPFSSSEGMCKGLVIEVDGGYHDAPEQKEADRKRQEWLEKNGYRVLRFRNEEVVEGLTPGPLSRSSLTLPATTPFRKQKPTASSIFREGSGVDWVKERIMASLPSSLPIQGKGC